MESNVQKMRSVIELIARLFESGAICTSFANSAKEMDEIEELYHKAKAAISAPPRNCDVGTAEEQHRRFIEYCNACDCPMGCIHRKEFIGMLDTRCGSMLKCYIRWAQMPYEEGGSK